MQCRIQGLGFNVQGPGCELPFGVVLQCSLLIPLHLCPRMRLTKTRYHGTMGLVPRMHGISQLLHQERTQGRFVWPRNGASRPPPNPLASEFRVQGSGLRASGFKVWGLGSRVKGVGSKAESLVVVPQCPIQTPLHLFTDRCRANLKNISQSRPNSGLGWSHFQCKSC